MKFTPAGAELFACPAVECSPLAPPVILRINRGVFCGLDPAKPFPRDATSKATAPHNPLCWGRFLDSDFGRAVLSDGDVA